MPMPTSSVVLVDSNDNAIGAQEKLRAHTLGSLHRAVSVFALDAKGALILQQRALTKYHSGGLWSNAACTHPRADESPLAAAERCLREEMTVGTALKAAFRFRYRTAVPPGLIEHEYDHVFVGTIDEAPQPAPDEVLAWRAVAPNAIVAEVAARPEAFTAWFRIAFPLYVQWCERADRWTNPFIVTPDS
ncbi:MAG: isopentenyl-diphosphate Delta-isomerase [Gemmatimonadaceae bacterium]